MSKSKRNLSRFLPFAFADRSVPAATRSARPWRSFETLEDRRVLAAVSFVPGTSTVLEDGTSGAPPTINVSGNLIGTSDAERTIFLSTLAGSASSPGDFSAASIVLKAEDYGAGKDLSLVDPAAFQSGGLTIVDDSVIESTESFKYTLSEASSELSINAQPDFTAFDGFVDIQDNDKATVRIVSGSSITENGGVQAFNIELVTDNGKGGKATLGSDLKVTVAAVGGSALLGTDYDFTGQTVTFVAGSSAGAIPVSITTAGKNDRLIEGTETIALDLTATAPGVTAQDSSIDLLDDDKYQLSFLPTTDKITEPGTSVDVNYALKIDFTGTGDSGTIADTKLTQDLVVNLDTAIGGGTNAESTDFKLNQPSVTFVAATAKSGDTQALSMKVFGDDLVEIDEVVQVTAVAANLKGSEVSPGADYKLTIEDPDKTAITVSAPATSPESGSITFTITLSNPVDQDSTFAFTPSGEAGAIGSGDGTFASLAPVFLKAGATQATITFNVSTDFLVENDEAVTVTLSKDPSWSIYGADDTTTPAGLTKTTLITNDDHSFVDLLSSPGSALEGAGPLEFQVVMSLPSETDTTITFADLKTGSATPGVDYTAITASPVVIKAGQTTAIVAVTLVDDNTAEPNETVNLKINSVTSDRSVTLNVATATGTIVDDDGQKASITSTKIVDEGAGTVSLVIELTGPVANDVLIDYATSDGSAVAPGDYTATAKQAKITAGATSTTITVPINDDGTKENDEDFFVTLTGVSGVGASIDGAKNKATVTIEDNDFAALSIEATKTVNENDGTVKVIVTRSGALDIAFDADLAVTSVSAGNPGDYIASSPITISFALNQATAEVSIPLVNDTTPEANEQFKIEIVSVTDAAVAITDQKISTVTIQDDDEATVTVSTDGPIVEKNIADGANNKVTATFQIAEAASVPIEITYNVGVDGTLTAGSAEAGDFAGVTGAKVTIPAGSLSTTATIEVIRDDVVEGDETFEIKITALSSTTTKAVAGVGNTAQAKITDDDSTFITVLDTSIGEGGAATVTFQISNPYEGEIKVEGKTFAGGSKPGTLGADFANATKEVVFKGGATTVTATYDTAQDTIVEPDETFQVEVSKITTANALNVTGIGNKGTVTIVDDDQAAIHIKNNPSVTEGSITDLQIELVAVAGSTGVQESFSVKLNSVNISAIAGSDYNALVDVVVNFPAGSGVGTIKLAQVTALADVGIEGNETFGVNLSGLADDPLAHGNVTIVDPDNPDSTVTIVDTGTATVSILKVVDGKEGGPNGQFLVQLSQAINDDTTTVTFTRSGSAKNISDYTSLQSVVFAKGQTQAFIDVNVVDDNLFEDVEDVTLTIATISGGSGVVGKGTDIATVKIESNDNLVVTDVAVSGGAQWAVAPYSLLTGSLHKNSSPGNMDTNSTLPWINLDTIHVTFNVDQASYIDPLSDLSLSLTGKSVANYDLDFKSISGGTAVWGITDGKGADLSLGADRLTLVVEGQTSDTAEVTGLGGSKLLNGAGTDSKYTFNVLPGDVADSGSVGIGDLAALSVAFGTSSSSATRADLNGSGGAVGIGDLAAFSTTFGSSLPAPAVAAVHAAFEIAVQAPEGGEETDDSLESLDVAFATL